MSLAGVEALYRHTYGRSPAVIASAPGRVNLIGEHTDYNGGSVLPIAITQRTFVAVGEGSGTRSRAVSAERDGAGMWEHARPPTRGAWWDHVAAALYEARSLGAARPAYEVAVASAVPVGAGLSSSAALEVATLLAALALDDRDAPPRAVADAAHRAETVHVGVPCGIMDQYACALAVPGHALHLDCATGAYTHVLFDRTVLIVDTSTPRSLRASDFATRRAECDMALRALQGVDPALRHLAHATEALLERAALAPPLDRRARHVVTEQRRVREVVDALEHAAPIGAMLNASHRSLRDDFSCSTPELDWVAEHAVARVGIDGARLTGAGWGGCAIVVGEEGALRALAPDVVTSFERAWGRPPRVWLTTAAAGGRVDQRRSPHASRRV